MACSDPRIVYQAEDGSVSFVERAPFTVRQFLVPCGQCLLCRIAKRSEWTTRLVHEKQMHEQSMFVTLTYDDERLPSDGSLHHEDFQGFMKRLRYELGETKVRYFMCGEYGDRFGRAHYHALLFGVWPEDSRCIRRGRNPLYTSGELERLWSLGFVSFGRVTAQTCAYVAGYCLKKVTGKAAVSRYRFVDPATGEVFMRAPEYARMSTHPGIGATWFERFGREVKAWDFAVRDGAKLPVPRYYDKLHARECALDVAELKAQREFRALPYRADQTPERLAVREACKAAELRFYAGERLL